MAGWLRYWMHREPIITWSFIIGGVGLALPLIVPPIREATAKPTAKHAPPPVADLIAKASAN